VAFSFPLQQLVQPANQNIRIIHGYAIDVEEHAELVARGVIVFRRLDAHVFNELSRSKSGVIPACPGQAQRCAAHIPECISLDASTSTSRQNISLKSERLPINSNS
jgi:hypothetical protein